MRFFGINLKRRKTNIARVSLRLVAGLLEVPIMFRLLC